MAVRKRGRGWLVVVEMGRDPTTGKRRRIHQTYSTRREAEREDARLRHEVATGLDLEPNRVTLGGYLQRWLEAVRPNLAPSTFRRYEGLLRHQVIPHIGSLQMSKLRPLHVQQLYARLQESGRVNGNGGISTRTLLHVHRVLSQALTQAVRWQLIPRNVCQSIEAPQAYRAEVRTYSPEETRHLLEGAIKSDSAYGDAVVLAVQTGLRIGELLGLKWEDFDAEHDRLSIRRSLQYLAGRGAYFRDPKTASGRRSIPLGEMGLEALRRLRRRQAEIRLAIGPAYEDNALVFSDPLGQPLRPYKLTFWFAGFARQLGLPALRWHDLRHTHATLLLMRGAHPKVVSERLGHSGIAITMDTYSHVLPSLHEAVARDLDAWLAGSAQG